MTEEDRIRAVNADTLRQDPTFQAAVLEARKDALEELVRVDPGDIDGIRNAQAKVRAIDALSTALAGFILRGMTRQTLGGRQL